MLKQHDGNKKGQHRHDWDAEKQFPIIFERLPEDRIYGYQFIVGQPKSLNSAGGILQEAGVDIL